MLYEKILAICKERGISIARLERECGLGNATVRGWSTASPSVDNLSKVAKHLGVGIDELLRTDE
jgi:transcriptional regulator with XRE-family HTH domain